MQVSPQFLQLVQTVFRMPTGSIAVYDALFPNDGSLPSGLTKLQGVESLYGFIGY